MQYIEFFGCRRILNFIRFFLDIFAQNIDCGYMLESPRRGGSNEYPQSLFWSQNKKNRYTSAYPSFIVRKWGLKGYTFHGHVFLMILFVSVRSLHPAIVPPVWVIFHDRAGRGLPPVPVT